LHNNNEHVTLRLEAHVAKEPGRVERLHRLRNFLVVDALTNFDRKIAEDGAGLGALYAFDADVADDEWLRRACNERIARPDRGRNERR
jgi:hypothetical protein